jgi:nucleotide-binding universal stress UspA family protein
MRSIMRDFDIDDERLLDLALGLREDVELRQAAEHSPKLRRRLEELSVELEAIGQELPQLLAGNDAGHSLPRSRWRILLAVDGAPHDGRACSAAARLAASFAGRVIVFHVRETSLPDSASVAECETEAASQLTRYVDELEEEHIPAESALGRARRGHVAESILQAATELSVDLIVMGADRRSRRLAFLPWHRTARRVVSRARCPVLVVA